MEIYWIYGKSDFIDCYDVRKKVFVLEQEFDLKLEFDEIDEKAYHLIIKENDIAIATARLFEEKDNKGVYHSGRICIIKEYRGKNLGKLIMGEIDKKAKELFANKLLLSAQETAVGFYEKMGYKSFGETYLDEFCPHIMMSKNL